jgi:hypothetical protein
MDDGFDPEVQRFVYSLTAEKIERLLSHNQEFWDAYLEWQESQRKRGEFYAIP